jgi:hypothetical protein
MLPVVLYGFDTWSLKLRERCRLRVSEEEALGRTFERKKQEVKMGMEKVV